MRCTEASIKNYTLQLTSNSSAVFIFRLVLRAFATEGKNVGYMLFLHSYHFLKTIIWLGSESEHKASVSLCVEWQNADLGAPGVTNKMSLSRSGQNFCSFFP